MKAKSTSPRKAIQSARFLVQRLYEAYVAQLYFETMPEVDPLYRYCFSTSNLKIPYQYQNVDLWLRAVAKHMSNRRPGHGGAVSTAEIVAVPSGLTDAQIEVWVAYVSEQLRAKAMRRRRRAP